METLLFLVTIAFAWPFLDTIRFLQSVSLLADKFANLNYDRYLTKRLGLGETEDSNMFQMHF